MNIGKQNVWFNISFFYELKIWHNILTELNNFILESHEDFLFSIKLSYNPQVIQFSILFENEEIMDKTGNQFLEHFKSFAINNAPNKKYLKIQGIGLPYPTNTIQTGLFNLDYLPNNLYNLRFALSEIILNSLREKQITDDDINTLATYLQIILAKSMKDFNEDAALSIFKELQNNFFTKGIQIRQMFYAEFQQITALSRNIMHEKDIKNTESLFYKWYASCTNCIKEFFECDVSEIKKGEKLKNFYLDHLSLIITQLGIKQEPNSSLFSLVNCSLIERGKKIQQ